MPAAALARSALGAREGEEKAVLLAFCYFFLLLCSYYLLRPVRDAMAANAGLERLPELFTYTFVVMLVITPVFGTLVSRVPKRQLLPVVYAFFATNLILFYVAFSAQPDSPRAAGIFFVWLSVFNMFVVSVFWSFMADVFRGGEARRLFGPIAAGGSAGAIVGPGLTQWLATGMGTGGLLLVATVLLLATVPCIRALGHWSVQRHGELPGTAAESSRPIGGSAFAGVTLVARSPYLLGVALLLTLGATAGTFMYLELQRVVFAAIPETLARTAFFARLDLAVNLLAFVCQGFVTSRLVGRLGIAGGLAAMPLVALASFVWLALTPLLIPLAFSQVLRRAGEFAVAKPSRDMLYTAVDPEAKYKAKNFIDTVVQRGSDSGASWGYASLQQAGTSLSGFAAACAAMMLVLTAIGLILGRAYDRREKAIASTEQGNARVQKPA
jgi:AAA family ATP:ADP antiporter